jgi:hypothetical protein
MGFRSTKFNSTGKSMVVVGIKLCISATDVMEILLAEVFDIFLKQSVKMRSHSKSQSQPEPALASCLSPSIC